jgi:tungstate transport system substrate-binding protein
MFANMEVGMHRLVYYGAVGLCMALVLQQPARAEDHVLLLASTIGPIDSGIVSVLEDRFEKETGIRVRHVGAGTGAALKIARQGSVDLVLVHAKSLEEKFIAGGFGTERIPFMYNDFVIVGPATDPAGIRGSSSALEALKKIAANKARFVSRGDKSGTNVAELVLWEKAGIKPGGPWYDVYERGNQGNGPTLKYADEQQAYTFIDRATWLALEKGVKLRILIEKDEALINYISLIPVNPKKFPRVNHRAALAFVQWLTDPAKGQLIVRDFGKDTYGSPLFFPNSREWNATLVK